MEEGGAEGNSEIVADPNADHGQEEKFKTDCFQEVAAEQGRAYLAIFAILWVRVKSNYSDYFCRRACNTGKC